ncbi:MAG: tetratricopeptide repeat protein [Okeania sp. SIO3H1]|nr:tetratricopeptide repeat protein [Okeania sp. SIO3H1]
MIPKTPTNFSPPTQQQRINFKQAKNFFSLGKVLAKKGEWFEAIAAYRKAIELAPDWKEARKSLADLENQLQEKTTNTQQQIEPSKKLTISDYPLDKILAKQEEQESENTTATNAVIVNSNLADDYHTNGDNLVEKGEKEEAINAYIKAIEINPELWEVHHKLGNLLQEKGELEAAVTTYHKSIELKPDFCWSHNNLADVLVKLEKWDEAIVSYQKAIELEPNFAWSHYNLAELCLFLEKWDEAVNAYRQFMQIQPDFSPKVEEKLNQALHQQVKERLEQALSYYRQAIENDPTDVESYQKALEIKPDDAELYFGLGNAWIAKGEEEKAIVAFQKAIENNPQFSKYHQNLGQTLEKMGRIHEAIAAFRNAVELDPHGVLSLINLGKLLRSQEQSEEAVGYLWRAVKLHPEPTMLWQQFGDLLLQFREREEAEEVYQKAIDIHPSFKRKKEPKINDNYDKYTSPRVGVCVHIFYSHMWERIRKYLENITVPYDLFITCPLEKKSEVSALVNKNHQNAQIKGVENIGMDVAPFIKCIKAFELWHYDVVLKLHTKNDKSFIRKEQGNILFQGTLGSQALVNHILNNFAIDDELGMVGPDYLYRSAQYLMYGNRCFVDNFKEVLNLESYQGDWGFFSGTMFWIRGSLLRNLADASHWILKLFVTSETSITGGDGTSAHAFERLFGLLPTASGMKTGLTYRRDSSATEFVLRVPETENLLKKPLRYACTTDHLLRSANAKDWAKIVSTSDFFDEKYYLENLKEKYMVEIATRSPATHFILYGDPEGYDPSDKFSTAYYHLRYKDIRERKLPALVHYIQHGMKEGRTTLPSNENWLELAERENLFSETWCQQTYSDLDLNDSTLKNTYMINDDWQSRATSQSFDPKFLPIVNNKCKDIQKYPLIVYLSEYALSEYALYDAVSRSFSNKDFYIIPKIVEQLHQNFGETRASLEALGTSLILQKKWDEARSVWTRVWDHFLNGSFVERYKSSVIQYDITNANIKSNFRDVDSSRVYSHDSQNYRVCIYTSLYGDRDDLLPIMSTTKGVDYICFTDRPRKSQGWQLRVVDPGLADSNLNAKIFKILPHIYLQEYDYSLFVDANTLFLGRINDLLKKCLSGSDFVMWRHPVRNDVYLEVATIMAHRRHEPDGLIEQIEAYANSGFPRKSGMVEGSFIWRKHKNQVIASFMNEWWQHIQNYTRRDQVSLGYLMWRNGLRPSVLPDELGTSRNNIYFNKISHKKEVYEVNKYSNTVNDSRDFSLKKSDVVFLYNPKFASSGSTVMRGEQLSSLVRPHLENQMVFYTSDDDVREQILFLTKGYLASSTPEQLEQLKKRNNIIIADFVDAVPDEAIVETVDVLVAASLSAYVDYCNRWPQKKVHYITHHADPRIVNNRPDCLNKRPHIGYFGEIANTIKSDKIQEFVDFYLVDTSSQNSTSWINHISEYNCHYAVRKTRKIDGNKPFTKGFIAAHCESNIIVQESATDVKYYLGADYPYLLPDNPDEADILDMLQHIHTQYGGREWNYGLEIMREVRDRSSHERVIRDFKELLSSL